MTGEWGLGFTIGSEPSLPVVVVPIGPFGGSVDLTSRGRYPLVSDRPVHRLVSHTLVVVSVPLFPCRRGKPLSPVSWEDIPLRALTPGSDSITAHPRGRKDL